MARGKERPVVWGTMAIGEGRRRRFLFRIEPSGVLAIRVGSPVSWTAFFALVLGGYLLLRGTPAGSAGALAGGAVGMLALGVLARAVASQPRERVLRSNMNLFLAQDSMKDAVVRPSGRALSLRVDYEGRVARINITRPSPDEAIQLLRSLLGLR